GLVVRGALSDHYSESVANTVRVLYGGSVMPDNIVAFAQQPEIDGALIGGASLDAQRLAKLVRNF
ncbi:MAG: triose-phosphate isomerase, partial [Ardenticatenaceae bacterium]